MSELLNVEELFASNVFTVAKMRERLPKKVFQEVIRVMEHGGELSMATADVVAKAMKDWAVEHGATHYTHWFQPLTGITAEEKCLWIFPEKNSSKANLTLLLSHLEDFARLLKQEVIQHGISHLRHS